MLTCYCAIIVKVARKIAEICKDYPFTLLNDQHILRRFAETTNPRKKCAAKMSESWHVKLPS